MISMYAVRILLVLSSFSVNMKSSILTEMKQNILLLNVFPYMILINTFNLIRENKNLTKSLLLDIQLVFNLSVLPTVGLID